MFIVDPHPDRVEYQVYYSSQCSDITMDLLNVHYKDLMKAEKYGDILKTRQRNTACWRKVNLTSETIPKHVIRAIMFWNIYMELYADELYRNATRI
ncbi:hypothetical protein MAR_035799 [Mya arenaria]|uniref:Uncharacterized protein n=1 Tax=Mya arenaria TaxID=6604 RepID=A0ABY7EL62_MYAAR|nr:hypothetical protein MAR_035799 [Mya arenaria]